ncbi:response regulator receiver protein [Bryocella elongata]|uniref:Response regulator receiver protein n=2 Tax=Bryocella elongata TaxID=863522 RepID=A0A1H6BRS2_9BACT|nr:response regulator receiver protein [Bryocella elongata]
MTPIYFDGGSTPSKLPPDLYRASDPLHEPKTPRVLVVDDETLIADTIAQILNKNGFRATAVYSGAAAIEFAQRECPDLVLSDVMMPNIDGVEAAIAIRQACPDTRIVLISGQAATVEILSRASERGYQFELLAKPIHPTQLIRHLRD